MALTTTRVQETTCKSCHHKIDSHSAVEDGTNPKEGDYSICAYCGTIPTFDKDLNLLPMPKTQLGKIAQNDPENYKIIIHAANFIKQRIDKN